MKDSVSERRSSQPGRGVFPPHVGRDAVVGGGAGDVAEECREALHERVHLAGEFRSVAADHRFRDEVAAALAAEPVEHVVLAGQAHELRRAVERVRGAGAAVVFTGLGPFVDERERVAGRGGDLRRRPFVEALFDDLVTANPCAGRWRREPGFQASRSPSAGSFIPRRTAGASGGRRPRGKPMRRGSRRSTRARWPHRKARRRGNTKGRVR